MMSDIAKQLLKVAKTILGLRVGQTFENDALRFNRTRHSIRITDLTDAGKRGKKVDQIVIYDLDMGRPSDDVDIDDFARDLAKQKSYSKVLKMVKGYVEYLRAEGISAQIQEYSLRGVDVAPLDFMPIKITGTHVRIEADYDSFVVTDLDDHYNEETCISRGKRKDIKQFHRWVRDNSSKIKSMTFNQVTQGMRKEGIEYHQYCAVD